MLWALDVLQQETIVTAQSRIVTDEGVRSGWILDAAEARAPELPEGLNLKYDRGVGGFMYHPQ